MAGQLNVRVISAKDLENQNLINTMWPYVKVVMGSQVQQSDAVEYGGCDPTFNFDTNIEYYGDSKMDIEIWNKNDVADDDLIGRLNVNLCNTVDMFPNHQFNGSFRIKNEDGDEAGSVDCAMKLHRDVGPDFQYPNWDEIDDAELLLWACARE
eukprot:Platyproteum_vivax@DN7079_c0_g1_i3.p1